MRLPRPAALLAVLVLPALLALPAIADEELAPDTRVVVAAVDTGMNPYHEFFHHGGEGPYAEDAPSAVTPELLAELGIGEDQIIDLTMTGDFYDRLDADAAQWAAVEPGQPYWYRGTNVIGLSFDPDNPLVPETDKGAHGVGVTAAVLNANPEAVVVMIESPVDVAGLESSQQLAAEKWAHTHPAVDLTTTSYGMPGSPPIPTHLSSTYTGVVRNGKLHFGAVDNSPALSPLDSTGGPWWSIGIAGYQEGTSNARTSTSGTFADFVANFTQDLPYCMDCTEGTRSVSGTSFATPRSAGVASKILLEARRAANHTGSISLDGEAPLMVDGDATLSNWELRRALEEAAAYIPSSGGVGDLPTLEAAPWVFTGWGAITADPEARVVEEALAHLGVGDEEPTRSKGSEVCTYMTAQIEARYLYWNTYAFMGESWLETDDPYIRC